jgi:hypothetical protein
VKPYDPSPVLRKLDQLEKDGHDVSGLRQCCPSVAEIHDALDFKKYIMAAVEQFSEVMQLEVKERQ